MLLISSLLILFSAVTVEGVAAITRMPINGSSLSQSSDPSSLRRQGNVRNLEMVDMKTQMGVLPLNSYIDTMKCKFANESICCGLVEESDADYKDFFPTARHHVSHTADSGNGEQQQQQHNTHCRIHKEYIPSAYELEEFEVGVRCQKGKEADERRGCLMDHWVQDVPHSNRWLTRVKIRTEARNQQQDVPVTSDDEKYLSRFNFTKVCITTKSGGNKESSSAVTVTTHWLEWIEPLTTHARHPFSYLHCILPPDTWPDIDSSYRNGAPEKPLYDAKGLINTDYVLLQSGDYLAESHSHAHKRIMLDGGSSTFLSSLSWFVCTYLLHGVDFHDLFAFEYTPLEVNYFWRLVPKKLLPFYHFYNVPISEKEDDPLSPTRFIKENAIAEDFVSFKLDIDHPSVELPIAFSIDKDAHLASLVDEFFFELHFQCEYLTLCGWQDHEIPEYFGEFKMDRPNVLSFFYSLRKKGIRAHFWP